MTSATGAECWLPSPPPRKVRTPGFGCRWSTIVGVLVTQDFLRENGIKNVADLRVRMPELNLTEIKSADWIPLFEFREKRRRRPGETKMSTVVEMRCITMAFGAIEVLKGIDLELEAGEVTGCARCERSRQVNPHQGSLRTS